MLVFFDENEQLKYYHDDYFYTMLINACLKYTVKINIVKVFLHTELLNFQ